MEQGGVFAHEVVDVVGLGVELDLATDDGIEAKEQLFAVEDERLEQRRELVHSDLDGAVADEAEFVELDALVIARWRASLPEKLRHGSHRALRQVLAAAVRWRWIDRNVAVDVKNPGHPRTEFTPFDTWADVELLAEELGPHGPFVIFAVGTGVRPEEAFGADWNDVDLEGGVLRVHRAYAKGRLKTYTKTERSRRRVPLRAKVVDALKALPNRNGVLFPSKTGGRIDINNWRSREWAPALEAAGIEHRRIYDMRHTFATWSLAAGMSIFTLSRRMGTSVQMIDQTYGHLARDADEYDRGLLDAYDEAEARIGHVAGTIAPADEPGRAAEK